MGREASLLFAREGAHVVAVDIDETAGARLVEDAAGNGAIEFVRADLTNLDDVARIADDVGSKHGRIDVLWNHAGAAGPRGFEFDEQSWQFSVDINLRAPVFLTQATLPLLREARDGSSVLFTASVSAVIASRNSPVYSAVKAGVVG